MVFELARRARSRALMQTRRFRRDDRGATAIEFGIIGLPFILMLVGTISVALYFFTNFSIENAVWSAARAIRTGEMQQSLGSYAGKVTAEDRKRQFKAIMCAKAPSFLDCTNKAVVMIQSSSTFGSITEPSCVNQGQMINQSNAVFNIGEASSVVLVTVCYPWEFGGKLPILKIGTLKDGSVLMQASAAFRTEPYN